MVSFIDLYRYNYFNNFNYFKNIDFFLLKIFKSPWNKNNNFLSKNKLIIEVFFFSNKNDIKNSIEIIFNIKILKVNTLIKKYKFKKKYFIKKKKVFLKFLY